MAEAKFFWCVKKRLLEDGCGLVIWLRTSVWAPYCQCLISRPGRFTPWDPPLTPNTTWRGSDAVEKRKYVFRNVQRNGGDSWKFSADTVLRAKFEEVHLLRGCCGWLKWTRSAVQNVASLLAGRLGETGGKGPTGCGEVARVGCLFASNFSVTRSVAYRKVERRLYQTWRRGCISDSLQAYRF